MAASVFTRSAGILLHPSSLPGSFGIGDFGPEAFKWVDTLAAMKQTWWQILPLGPTGAGDSPYQSFSAFAGNINLLSPELLLRDGLIEHSVIESVGFSHDRIEYQHVAAYKLFVLREAWGGFRAGKGPAGLKLEFEKYITDQAHWLPDFVLFTAIRAALGGAALADWPTEVALREPSALAALEKELASEIGMHQFGQFLFDRQWSAVRQYANERGIQILGDAPIFIAPDSADVWANPDRFLLDADRNPTAVAGVPPDYFSPTGQHWGNPLYNWDRMRKDGYSWWVNRIRRLLEQCDAVRLDHFRGFAAAWHIPAGEKDATNGRWVPGPGADLFDTLIQKLGPLPVVAEDLGLITEDVHELRLRAGLPGMRVLQFALSGPENPYWPHNYDPLTVAYTGTHDNDTTNGWYAGLSDVNRWVLAEYLGRPVQSPAWDLIRVAWASVAVVAITPLQDLLELGSEARMNIPGKPDGNWQWRFRWGQFLPEIQDRLANLTTIYNRTPPVDAIDALRFTRTA